MPREITDQTAILDAIGKLEVISELLEEQNGKRKYGGDLDVIVYGRAYSNGKKVGPYIRLLVYGPGEEIIRQGDWGGNTFYLGVEGDLDVYVRVDEYKSNGDGGRAGPVYSHHKMAKTAQGFEEAEAKCEVESERMICSLWTHLYPRR